MRLADLSPEIIEKIKTYRYDRIIEKHEGPERWSSILEFYEPEFLQIDGEDVLLPIGSDQHPNVTILRTIRSVDQDVLIVFLKDTTYYDDWFSSGFMAVCERFPGERFLLATVYHEWFIFENPA